MAKLESTEPNEPVLLNWGGIDMQSSLIGKIEKAKRYAEEKDRVTFSEFSAQFHGENDDPFLEFDPRMIGGKSNLHHASPFSINHYTGSRVPKKS